MFRFLNNYISYYKRHKFITDMVVVNIALVGIPLIIVGFLSYSFMLRSTQNNLSSSIDASFTQMSASLDQYFESINIISKFTFFDDKVLDILRSDPDLQDAQKIREADKFLKLCMQLSDSIREIYILTNTEKQFGPVTYAISEEVMNYINENRETIINSSGLIMTSIRTGRDVNVILAVRLIKFTEDLSTAGIGVLIISSENILEYVKNVYDSSSFKVYIVDSHERLVAASDLKDLSLYTQLLSNVSNFNHFKHGDKSYFVRQKYFENTNWRFIATSDVEKMREGISSYIHLIIVLIILIIITAVFMTFLFNLSSSRQINMLQGAMQKVSDGNLKIQLQNFEKGEFSDLGHGFNKMVREIRDMVTNIFTTQQRLYETELQRANAELYGLQSQINSHFLYNSLTAIRGMAKLGAINEVDMCISALVYLLRYATKTSNTATLDEEMEYVKTYVSIQQMRFSKLKFKVYTDESIKDACLLRLTVQPIVENAITHGGKNNILINVSAFEHEGFLVIKILDNGNGMTRDQLEALKINLLSPGENHVGIANIQKRIKTFYGEDYGITIKSYPNIGTHVNIKLPLLFVDTPEKWR